MAHTDRNEQGEGQKKVSEKMWEKGRGGPLRKEFTWGQGPNVTLNHPVRKNANEKDDTKRDAIRWEQCCKNHFLNPVFVLFTKRLLKPDTCKQITCKIWQVIINMNVFLADLLIANKTIICWHFYTCWCVQQKHLKFSLDLKIVFLK